MVGKINKIRSRLLRSGLLERGSFTDISFKDPETYEKFLRQDIKDPRVQDYDVGKGEFLISVRGRIPKGLDTLLSHSKSSNIVCFITHNDGVVEVDIRRELYLMHDVGEEDKKKIIRIMNSLNYWQSEHINLEDYMFRTSED